MYQQEVKLNVPKKYQERFGKLVKDEYLADGMKYIMYYAEGWGFEIAQNEWYDCVPIYSKKEAIDYLKMASKIEKEVD